MERIQEFVIKLKAALDELKMIYPLLKDRIREQIALAFDADKSSASFQTLRDSLSERCEALVITIRDIDLKAFCLRLIDSQLPESDWLESIGSYVATTPPLRWKDEDENVFEEKLRRLVPKLLKSVNKTHNVRINRNGCDDPNGARWFRAETKLYALLLHVLRQHIAMKLLASHRSCPMSSARNTRRTRSGWAGRTSISCRMVRHLRRLMIRAVAHLQATDLFASANKH